MIVLLSALLVVVLTAASCTTTPSPPQGSSPGTVPPPELQRFYTQTLTWSGCAPFAVVASDRKTFADPAYECAYLDVPLDYGKVDARTIQLAVLRQKAKNSAGRIGSLVFNPGGPGESGTSTLPSLSKRIADGQLAQLFDLVGFDPRGVGSSKPAIHCVTPAEHDALRLETDVDTSPAGVAKTEARNQDYAGKCATRTGPDVLAAVGTREVAKDLDILRSALGDSKLNYIGYSYGTRIGSTYAESFGANVRTMVLDGALDPNQTLVDREVAQARGFEGAFDAFARWCAQRRCPLGQDPAHAPAVFQALVRPLIVKPARSADGRQLSYPDAVTGTILALYSQQLWDTLLLAITNLAGGDGSLLLRMADAYEGRESDGSYATTLEAFTAIGCIDDPPITDPAQLLEADKRSREVAPFRDDGHPPAAVRDPCAFWPVPPTGQAHQPKVTGLPQTLVISVTGDPATPYQAGVQLAAAIGARLLTAEGTQHTIALQGNKCVDDLVINYVVNLALPASDTTCRGQ
ncbi:MAG: putative exported protease [Pseudonocardia sp.]|nr:putative exported protease [Pseudonocardia sp.]